MQRMLFVLLTVAAAACGDDIGPGPFGRAEGFIADAQTAAFTGTLNGSADGMPDLAALPLLPSGGEARAGEIVVEEESAADEGTMGRESERGDE